MKLHKTGYLKIPQATSKGYIECPADAVFDWTYPDSKMRRGRVQRGGRVSPTLTANYGMLLLYEGYLTTKTNDNMNDSVIPEEARGKKFRIRKLTPRECFRLMDVSEGDIDKMMATDDEGKQLISNSQLYKCAGNSICVGVMTLMFDNMIFGTKQSDKGWVQLNLFD